MGVDGVSGAGSDSVGGGGGGGGDAVTVHVRCSNGSKFSVQAPLDSTVGSFKALLAETSDVPAEQQRLIYKGRILKDGQTLESYGLECDHTVHLVRGLTPAASTDAPAGSNLGASGMTTNGQGTGRGLGSNEGGEMGGATFGGSLFPGLGVNGPRNNGTFGLHGNGIPEFDQIQQQLSENPNMMREIMNLPAIQNLVSNPELVRDLIMGNPQMRQIIDQNPELAHILNDPSILRQTLETARNPELTREMMRNTDRAMSNIESSPEGFNMLRRMYETVQEPLMNATAMAGESGVTGGFNPFAALLGNQGRVQNRDGSANSLATGSETTTGSPAPNSNPLPNPWSNPGRASGAQNNITRSPAGGDTRVPGPGDLGGDDFAGLERMAGGMQDPSLLNQVMQNPAVSQIMQSLLSNPQYMNQILGFNPQMRSLLESNTQLREMLQNPEFLRQLSSPETLQQLLALQQSLPSLSGLQTGQELNQTGAAAGTPNTIGLDLLMNMFDGLNAGGLNIPNTSNVPPEELYATQLSQLQDMGFFDTQENIRVLSATAGNVHAAVERLLGNPYP